jgi:hypothetical protein
MIEEELARLANAGVVDLYISSGDGTIQAIQTILAEKRMFSALPRLCLLPHGSTNMTAADLGFGRRSIAAQASFIVNQNVMELRARPTLRVANPADGLVRHGMFLGTGALAAATRYCQRVFNQRGVTGSFATFATLAGAVVKTLSGKDNLHDEDRFDRPYRIAVRSDGQHAGGEQQLLFLCTTLEKLILGCRPFWGGKNAELRGTLFPYPTPNLFRWLLPTLYGREHRRPPPGAVSLSANAFDIGSSTEYVIDGEFFLGPPDAALHIETGPMFTYITA